MMTMNKQVTARFNTSKAPLQVCFRVSTLRYAAVVLAKSPTREKQKGGHFVDPIFEFPIFAPFLLKGVA